MNLLWLDGCRVAPLASYMKALGVLRLVGAQADPEARGCFRDGRFVLRTSLTREALVDFFCDRYAPTPLLSPWNGGSGFYGGDNQSGIAAIEQSSHPRFAAYRESIALAREAVAGREKRGGAGAEKNALLSASARSWPDSAFGWLSAALMQNDLGEPAYPALLGTGGNDGRLDFTNNFMQRLGELFEVGGSGAASPTARALLPNALFDELTDQLTGGTIGQFNPGATGGANSGLGFGGAPVWNLWDFVLMLEGAVMLRVAGVRKLESTQRVQAAAPFAVRSTPRGYGTAADKDQSARGEQWLPIWGQPASAREVHQLFAEGRLLAGGRSAEGALDAATAIASLGVSRGVESFARYSYLERNGQANLAVPLATLRVHHRPEVLLLEDVRRFLESMRRLAGDETASAVRISRRLDEAALRCASDGASSQDWQALVMVLGAAEQTLLSRPKWLADKRFITLPRLRAGWLERLDDGSAEVAVAVALASARDLEGAQGPLRAHMCPLSGGRSESVDRSGVRDPRVVWQGRSLTADLAEIAVLRARDSRGGLYGLSSPHPAGLQDVAAFLEGRVDDERILALARGLTTLRFEDVPVRGRSDRDASVAHGLFRLAYATALTGPIRSHAAPLALRLLRAGRLEPASEAAARFLVARGLRPKLRRLAGGAAFAERLAASIAIPISAAAHASLLRLLTQAESNTAVTTEVP